MYMQVVWISKSLCILPRYTSISLTTAPGVAALLQLPSPIRSSGLRMCGVVERDGQSSVDPLCRHQSIPTLCRGPYLELLLELVLLPAPLEQRAPALDPVAPLVPLDARRCVCGMGRQPNTPTSVHGPRPERREPPTWM